MKSASLPLAILAGCLASAGPVAAQVTQVESICEVQPDGAVHTVKVFTIGIRNYTYHFINTLTHQSFVLQGPAPATFQKFAVTPGNYTLKFSEQAGSNPPQGTFAHTVSVRPYTLGASGTSCTLNPLPHLDPGVGRTPVTPKQQ